MANLFPEDLDVAVATCDLLVQPAQLSLDLVGPGADLLRLLLGEPEHGLAVGQELLHVLGAEAEEPLAHPCGCGVHRGTSFTSDSGPPLHLRLFDGPSRGSMA